MLVDHEGLTPPQSPPMHERRPLWLREAISAHFEQIQDPENNLGSGYYLLNGDHEDYTFIFPGTVKFHSSELLKTMERKRQRQLRILDIGAGAGAFVLHSLESGHDAQGITAHNYLDTKYKGITNQLPKSAYIIGDANNMDAIPDIGDEYDLIIGHSSFIHFADPLGTLEQAANKLAPQGMLVTTQIDIGYNGFYKYRNDASAVTPELILAQFDEAGFMTGGSVYPAVGEPETIETLMATRGDEIVPLRLPVGYEGEPTSWRYTWAIDIQAA